MCVGLSWFYLFSAVIPIASFAGQHELIRAASRSITRCSRPRSATTSQEQLALQLKLHQYGGKKPTAELLLFSSYPSAGSQLPDCTLPGARGVWHKAGGLQAVGTCSRTRLQQRLMPVFLGKLGGNLSSQQHRLPAAPFQVFFFQQGIPSAAPEVLCMLCKHIPGTKSLGSAWPCPAPCPEGACSGRGQSWSGRSKKQPRHREGRGKKELDVTRANHLISSATSKSSERPEL